MPSGSLEESGLKGLEIAHRFFDDWGLPYLRAVFPEISERVACFLCGSSQSLGNDDDLSRDHTDVYTFAYRTRSEAIWQAIA